MPRRAVFFIDDPEYLFTLSHIYEFYGRKVVYPPSQKGTYFVETYLKLPIDIACKYMYSTVLFINTLHKKGF